MRARIRRKRASPTDLYRSCQAGGDCIPDVKNKIEGNTWADKLLKWFGNIIYLGGLGIGTGRGTGGSYGYRPIQSGAGGRVPQTVPVRPTVPIETIPEVPTGFITPEAPSVIPMVELPVDTSVVIDNVTSIGPSDPVLDVSVIYEAHNPTFEANIPQLHPTTVAGGDNPAEVVIGSSSTPVHRIVLDSVEGISGAIDAAAPAEVYNVFVDPQGSGTAVGALEEIELGPLQQTFEIEERATSTPRSFVDTALTRTRQFYNRFVQQARIRDPAFLGRPSRLVTFGFENPAFSNEDLTLQFMDDVQDIAAAPDPAFSDVRVLHRPVYSETPGGTVRASRLGTRGFMTTRSGALLGQDVHFYYDISSIEDADTIEMLPLGNRSSAPEVVHSLAESSFIDNIYPDEELIDEVVEQFNNSHLVLSETDESGRTKFVSLGTPWLPKAFVSDTGSGYTMRPPILKSWEVVVRPATRNYTFVFSADYYLHPSLRRIRRKRKRSFIL